MRTLFRQDWVVYLNPPFGGPQPVLCYLAGYTHRVAISNHRLVAFQHDQVTFRYKDYAQGNKKRLMTLSSGVYLYIVTDDNGDKTIEKFVIIKWLFRSRGRRFFP